MADQEHIRLMIPGPVEVRQEILEAQTQGMIGHRSESFSKLYASLQEKLRRVFLTGSRVYVVGTSGTGLWEAASRNCIRDDKKVLHLANGAFSERWATVSRANGKQVDVVSVDWGQGFTAERVAEALKQDHYDAVCLAHNETSTGVVNPLAEIAEVVREHDGTLLLVDTVSGFLGAELRTDDWGIDIALTSSQKAFALPPGLALGATSDRALARAEEIPYRGYYFDLLTLEKSLLKNNTPSTPPISLMFAADRQLDDILAEGLEARWARHLAMRDRTIAWALENGFGLFAAEGFRSPTVTAITNTRGIDVNEMAAYMRERGFAMDRGYGKLRGETFRIAHMGDLQMEVLEEVLAHLSAFVKQAG